ncbi:MAG: AI-2E family transporter, partial [Albidovulum sp.]
MALPARQQAIYWGIVSAIFLAALWALGHVMLPFIVGGALAYFLDPVADRLERAGLSRTAATSVISIVALVTFVLLALLIVPMLVRQLIGLVNAAPTIFGQLQDFLSVQFPSVMDSESVVRDTLSSIGKTIQARGGELATGLLTSALSVINAVVFIIVVPVVTFYLLLDWDN